MGVTAGIFLASILPKEMRYLVYSKISMGIPHGNQVEQYLFSFPSILSSSSTYINLFLFVNS
jgi:hypothetical protein